MDKSVATSCETAAGKPVVKFGERRRSLREGTQDAASGKQPPVIVLGGGPSQEIFLHDLFARYGAFTLLDIDSQAPGRKWAEKFLHASIYDFERCRRVLAPLITGDSRIVTFATGPAGKVCYRLGETFGVPRRSSVLAASTNNKQLLSDVLSRQGLRVPRQMVIGGGSFDKAALADVTFPAVLKPVEGGGGLNVRVVDGADEVVELCRQHKELFLLQEKLSGREELLWLIVRKGRVAALLNGENLFDGQAGWQSPLGLALQRVPLQYGLPQRWDKLANQLVHAFHLEDDFMVAELIATENGDFIIDVELNGLSGFACSKILERNLLTSLLVDTYLKNDFDGPETTGWVSGLAFFAAAEPTALTRMAQRARSLGGCVVEPPRNVTRLECFGTSVYKGGYFIITDARDLADAAAKARAIFSEVAL